VYGFKLADQLVKHTSYLKRKTFDSKYNFVLRERVLHETQKGSIWNQKAFSYGDSRRTRLEPFSESVVIVGLCVERVQEM
jgi:hypothetical protein